MLHCERIDVYTDYLIGGKSSAPAMANFASKIGIFLWKQGGYHGNEIIKE